MPPWDNVLLPRAPNAPNYAPPLVGPQYGSMLANLPEQYFQGQEERQKLQEQNAFPEGLPELESEGAYGKIMSRAAKVGGLGAMQYISPLLQMEMYTKMGSGAAALMSRSSQEDPYAPSATPAPAPAPAPTPGYQQSSAQPPNPPKLASVPGASGPSNITGKSQGATGGQGDVAANYFSQGGMERDSIAKATAVVASMTGERLRPNDPMSPAQQAAATKVLDNYLRTGNIEQVAQRSPSEMNQRPQPSMAAEAANNASAPARSYQKVASADIGTATDVAPTSLGVGARGGGANAGAPAPVSAAPETPVPGGQSQPQVPPTRVAQAQTPQRQIPPYNPAAGVQQPNPLQGLLRPGVNPADAVRYYQSRAQEERAKALAASANGKLPAAATPFLDAAKVWDKKAEAIQNALIKTNEATTTQKDIISGASGADANLKAVQKRSEAVYNGLAGAAANYEEKMSSGIHLAQGILNDPATYTGALGSSVMNWNRIKAIWGDSKAITLQEMLQKVTALGVLEQMNQQRFELEQGGQQNAGRMFKQTVDQIEKAVIQVDTSLPGNRALTELTRRSGELSSKVAELARNYMAQNNNLLDVGFDQQLSQYLASHPIFSKEEIANPSLLGVPQAPEALKTKEAIRDWATKMGVRPDGVIRAPNGLYYHPFNDRHQ